VAVWRLLVVRRGVDISKHECIEIERVRVNWRDTKVPIDRDKHIISCHKSTRNDETRLYARRDKRASKLLQQKLQLLGFAKREPQQVHCGSRSCLLRSLLQDLREFKSWLLSFLLSRLLQRSGTKSSGSLQQDHMQGTRW